MNFLENETLIQFIKYGLAGGVATLTHICIFHVVGWKLFPCLQAKDYAVRLFKLKIQQVDNHRRAIHSMITNGIAFLVANMVAYILNIIWVFERGRHHIVVEIFFFYLVSGISTVFGTMLMGALIRRFGILTTHAFAANIVTAVMINYAMRKFFIFQG
ncbi:MAG: GtrA family protein [Desulfocapsaceae bacterium]|nr:GtrA family protein [Desulfocapsaceae bacterium]